MDVQPIVIGTAGHVDHGKSTLVRALTGTDPDRLKEEKERGLTIDLGFASLELPDGRRVGIVDVPGHERFVRNMVAGATGTDLVLLVVAADDAVMPQTREHLQIVELLGVQRGLVALTKVDLVEEELVELAEADVREAVAGTFLDGAPLVRVSGTTGAGLDRLREELVRAALAVEPRSAEGVFRMPIQRVFSKAGLGTVVTGIPVSGRVAPGDVLEVLPGGQKGRVRGVQAYGRPAEAGRAGHSTAVNLSDVDRARVRRGMVACAPGYFEPRRMLGARVTALADLAGPIENRTRIRLHTGTADPAGEVVVLDRDAIEPGGSGLVQLRLDEPVVAAPGDRFVLRRLSPVETLGGGVLLEESKHRFKRFKAFVIEELARAESGLGSPRARVDGALAAAGPTSTPLDALARAVRLERGEVEAHLAALVAEGRASEPRPGRFVHVEPLERAAAAVREALAAWLAEHPHRLLAPALELKRRTALDAEALDLALERLRADGAVELEPGGRVRVPGREDAVPRATAALAEEAAARLEAAGLQPPAPAELAGALGAGEAELRAALELLADRGRAEHVGGELWLAAAHVARAREAVVRNCERHGHLEIPELRDELGTSRKYLIPLLEAFDAAGVTMRQGGHRVLRRR